MLPPRYLELVEKVDAFFARVMARHPERMQCSTGCNDCCHQQLTVTAVEADAVRAGLSALSDEVRGALVRRAQRPDAHRCAALDDDGRCALYAVRPLVCRSHGVPIRTSPPGALPVIVACEKNFRDGGPAAADPDCVLDQATLSTMLLAVDAERLRRSDSDRRPAAGERVSLAEVIAGMKRGAG